MHTQRTILAGVAALGLATTSGCDSLESPGHPFAPVAVETSAPAAPVVQAVAEPTTGGDEPWETDPSWTEPDGFEISSEQMMGETPAVADAGQTDEAVVAQEPESAALDVAPAATEPTAVAVSATAISAMQGWPLRLVKTVPEAMPPRAILGLPDGREVVVTPGSLVSDQGVIVMSIARDHVELARVEAQGDHASISPVTLLTQY